MVLTFTALFLVAAAPAAALTVEDCVRLALARSPAVRAALADAQAAAALVRSARAAYWPSLAAKGDYGVAKGFDRAVTNGGHTAGRRAARRAAGRGAGQPPVRDREAGAAAGRRRLRGPRCVLPGGRCRRRARDPGR